MILHNEQSHGFFISFDDIHTTYKEDLVKASMNNIAEDFDHNQAYSRYEKEVRKNTRQKSSLMQKQLSEKDHIQMTCWWWDGDEDHPRHWDDWLKARILLGRIYYRNQIKPFIFFHLWQ